MPEDLPPRQASTDKLPPHDVQAEESVIAALMVDPDAMARVEAIVQPAHFYRDESRWTYQACHALWQRGEAINEVTVAHELVRADKLDDAGGRVYLSRIVGDLPTAIGVEHYARIVQRDAMYRALTQAGAQMVQLAYQGGPDAEATLAKCEELLSSVQQAERGGDLTPLARLIEGFWEAPLEGADSGEPGPGGAILTSFGSLDELLAGFRRSNLVICAAKTSFGKSALLLEMARHAAIGQKARVAVFTIEMSGDELAIRLLSAQSGVPSMRLKRGQMDEGDEARAMEASGELADAPIYVDDSAKVTVPSMRAKLRRLKQQLGGLDVVIVDYLQLMQASQRRENKTQEVTEISHGLKMLARELDVAVIAAAQLSRAPDQRPNHEPILSDLRESGSIEQDADVVMFLYREDKYVSREEWESRHPGDAYPQGVTKVIVSKHRNGPTGACWLRFDEARSRFYDLQTVDEAQMELAV